MYAIKGKAAYGAPLIQNMTSPKSSGILLVTLNVIAAKDEIYQRLEAMDNVHFGAEQWRGFDEIFFKQLASEHRVLRQAGGMSYHTYEKVSKNARNEMLDVMCYAYAAMKSFLVNVDAETFWARQLEIKKPPARIIQRSLNQYG